MMNRHMILWICGFFLQVCITLGAELSCAQLSVRNCRRAIVSAQIVKRAIIVRAIVGAEMSARNMSGAQMSIPVQNSMNGELNIQILMIHIGTIPVILQP